MEQRVEYNHDFYGWLMQNAKLIREGRLSDIDAENVADELESMGKSEKREIVSRLTVLLTHLLKWQFQAAKRSTSWRNTIIIQRLDIRELLEDSPSLTAEIEEKITSAYEKACLEAENETGIERKNFPETCPYTFEQLLDDEFFPENEENDTNN